MYEETTTIPLITIGITAYNAALTIDYAIQSALAQDWPNKEIIVIDDASTDNTSEIIKKLAEANSNIQVIRQEQNKGVAAARNKIIKTAKGEFIAFFDDDDESATTRLNKQYRRITEYECRYAAGEPILCHTARLQKYASGKEAIAPTAGCITGQEAPNGREMLERILWGKPCEDCYGAMATCSQMGRRQVYEVLGGFDEELRRSEDTEFTIRHAAAGGHFVGIAEPLVTQIMTKSKDKNLEEELACTLYYLEKHKEHFPSLGAYTFQMSWIKAKYAYFTGNKLPLLKLLFLHPIRSFQKILWALPNYATNQQFKSFHNSEE